MHRLNSVTRVDAYLMARVDYLLDHLIDDLLVGLWKASLITTLDLTTWEVLANTCGREL